MKLLPVESAQLTQLAVTEPAEPTVTELTVTEPEPAAAEDGRAEEDDGGRCGYSPFCCF